MRIHTLVIILTVILFVFVVIVGLSIDVTKFNENMNAVKLDANGNILGSVSLGIQFNITEILLHDTRFSYSITDFDTLKSFTSGKDEPFSLLNYLFISTSAVRSDKKDIVFCNVYSSPEFDQWLIWNRSEDIFYVASLGDNRTTLEVLTYFADVIKDSRIPTNVVSTSE